MKELFHVQTTAASPQAIQGMLVTLGHGMPDAHLALLLETNGAESAFHDHGGDCLHLWSTDDLVQLNRDYQIDRWLPDVVAIGDNGGDDAIVLDMTTSIDANNWPVMRVGLGDLDRASLKPVAANFQEWIHSEFRIVGQANTSTSL